MLYVIYRNTPNPVGKQEVLKCLDCPYFVIEKNVEMYMGEASFVRGFADNSIHVVDASGGFPVIVDKVAIPYTLDKPVILPNGSDIATISGLPEGATAEFDRAGEVVSGGVIRFTANAPGEYEIKVFHPLFLTTTIAIHSE